MQLFSLSGLSGIVMLVAFIPYVMAIIGKQTRPSKASWIVWATLDLITLAGMFAKGTVNGQIVGTTIGALSVAALSFRYGKPGWSTLDRFCIGCAGLAIVLWQVFNSPVVGLSMSLIATCIAATPTWVNAWHRPEEEDKLAWTLYWVSCVLAVIAIPSWTMAHAAQPMTFLAIESTMMFILFVRPRIMSGT